MLPLTPTGHPEWSSAIIDPLIDGWVRDGTFTAEYGAEARKRTKQDDGAPSCQRAR